MSSIGIAPYKRTGLSCVLFGVEMADVEGLLKLIAFQNERLNRLEQLVINLTEHRHDEWGRIFCISENGFVRPLGSLPTYATPNPANQ